MLSRFRGTAHAEEEYYQKSEHKLIRPFTQERMHSFIKSLIMRMIEEVSDDFDELDNEIRQGEAEDEMEAEAQAEYEAVLRHINE